MTIEHQIEEADMAWRKHKMNLWSLAGYFVLALAVAIFSSAEMILRLAR